MSLSEFRKSINSVLYERTTSPLYGTFILSWLVCNWKIVFATFTENFFTLGKSRISYIEEIADWQHVFWFPFLSSIVLILIVPFAANGAYWTSLEFKKWRNNKKNKVEGKILLSVEQSIELRSEILSQEEKFNELLKVKDEEIEKLDKKIQLLSKQLKEPENPKLKVYTKATAKELNWNKEFTNLEKNKTIYDKFEIISTTIQEKAIGRKYLTEILDMSNDEVNYFFVNDILSDFASIVRLTEKGEYFLKIITNKKF